MSVEELERYWSRLWSRVRAPGAAVSLWMPGPRVERVLLAHGAAQFARAVDHLDRVEGRDVYATVLPMRAGLEPWQRGGANDAIALPALFLDVDVGGGDGHAAAALPPTMEDAMRAVLEVLPEPSMVVATGGGMHLYWVLRDPPAFAPGGASAHAPLMRALARRAGDAFRARGWHLDEAVSEPARVLRPAGTTNRKRAGDPRPVSLLIDDGPDHDLEGLARIVGVTPAGAGAAAATTSSSAQPPQRPAPAPSGAAGAPGPAGEPLALDEYVARARAALSRSSAELARRILDGQPLGEPGRREETLHRACSLVAFVGPWPATPEQVVAVLAPSIDATARQPAGHDAPGTAEALDRARRALRDRAEEESWLAGLRDALPVPPSAGASTPPDVGGRSGAPYTDDELDELARLEGVASRDDLRWIVQRGGSYYILTSRGYLPPVSREDLEVACRNDLARAPTPWVVESAAGKYRRLTVPEFLRRYSTVVRRVVADLTLTRSRMLPDDDLFVEAVSTLRRDLAPRRDERVERWLELLGGDQVDSLLDWIATATDLRRQTAALYLWGRGSAGKGMLVQGLARLWGASPTMIDHVIGSAFNADLIRCPLVWADERLPRGVTADQLRAFVGSSTRPLARKYLTNVDLHGAPRLVLTGNTDRMLSVGSEDLDSEEIAATALRFLTVHVGDAPRDYLRQIGGRSATDDWVDGDRIARHALWLREARAVAPGARFLVEGRAEAVHRRMAARSDTTGLVLEWLVRALDAPPSVVESPPVAGRLIVGDGEVLATSEAIQLGWVQVLGESAPRVPTGRVGRALATLSRREARVGGRRFRSVDVELVLEWARDNLVGDVDRIAARVRAARTDSARVVRD